MKELLYNFWLIVQCVIDNAIYAFGELKSFLFDTFDLIKLSWQLIALCVTILGIAITYIIKWITDN